MLRRPPTMPPAMPTAPNYYSAGASRWRGARARRVRSVAFVLAPSFGAICWILLWAAINTGPGYMDLEVMGGSWTGLSNGVRATFPLAVLALWPIHLLLARRGGIRRV